ncbi:MAG: hypothetical protein WDM89_20960 [Rhizomicrobium sp.]
MLLLTGAHRVTIALQGSPQTSAMLLVVPKDAALKSVDIQGEHLAAPKDDSGDTLLACMSRDCATKTIALTLGSHRAVALTLIEDRYGGAALCREAPGRAAQDRDPVSERRCCGLDQYHQY